MAALRGRSGRPGSQRAPLCPTHHSLGTGVREKLRPCSPVRLGQLFLGPLFGRLSGTWAPWAGATTL